MELESYMYEDKREVKVLDTGDRKGQHQRPHAVEKSRNKREGRPRSFPQLTSFPSHLCRTARASHPIAPPPSHVPPPRELPPRELAPWAQAIHAHGSSLVALSSPLGPRSATRGKGGEWRMAGFAKNRTPTTRQKKTLVQRANSNRPSRSAAAPLPPFACLGNPAEEGPLSRPPQPGKKPAASPAMLSGVLR